MLPVSRPLIGVTTSEVRLAEHADPLPEGDPPQREMALGMVYMRAIELAGGMPVVLPPLGHDTIAPLLDRLDGVCLSGGPDIDPEGYGEQTRNPQLGTDRARPRRLRARARPARRRARDAGARHLPRRPGAQRRARRHAAPARRRPHGRLGRAPPGRARARADPPRCGSSPARGSREVMGVTEAEVNSFHHQAADRLGQGLRAGGVGAGRDRRGHRERRRGSSTSACSGTPSRSSSAPEHLALFRELVEEADAYGQPRAGGAGGMSARTGPTGATRAARRRGRSASRRRSCCSSRTRGTSTSRSEEVLAGAAGGA